MAHYQTICLKCQAVQKDAAAFICAVCQGSLGFRYDYANVNWDDRFRNNMWRYWPLLPVAHPEQIITLGEGGTPLLRSRTYPEAQLYLKDETRNPTGSHKDRPLSVAINHGHAIGATVSFVVSTGSTGISNAALAARAGMGSVVVMTEGVPAQRIYPMFALGSQVIEVKGAIDTIIEDVIRLCREYNLYLSSTSRDSNPYQGEGNKTIAYEIVEDLGHAPDWVIAPVGGGGTISGIWRGFEDLQALGMIVSLPRLVGVTPKDYNALEIAFEHGLERWEDILALPYDDCPPSILVKLAHSYPPDGMEALETVRRSGGFFLSVSDEEALIAQQQFGRREGLYMEPSTGACLAGVGRLIESGRIGSQESIVALVSGSGFRENFLTMEYYPLQKQSIVAEELAAALIKAARTN
jgi:threonine synthase